MSSLSVQHALASRVRCASEGGSCSRGGCGGKVNSEIVSVQRVVTDAGAAQLRSLIEQHVARTGSPKGQRVLDDWAAYLPQFWQVVPPSEQDTPEASDASPSDVVEKKTEPQKAR